ncbi:hypothetical protein [Rhodanobacter sp. BL-MT-08]
MQQKTDVATLINDLDAGIFAQRLSAALCDTALGVVTTGKKGKVNITIDLARIGDSSQVTAVHQIKYARPTTKGRVIEEATTSTPLHVGIGGALSLFPESQTDLFLERQRAEAERSDG